MNESELKGVLLEKINQALHEIEQMYNNFDDVYVRVMEKVTAEYDIGFYDALRIIKRWIEQR